MEIYSNRKKDILILCILITILNIVSINASQSVEISYSFLNDTLEERTIDYDSVLLKIRTTKDAICKYSTSNTLYSSMEQSFDPTLGLIHEKSLLSLEDGAIYKYYVKCVEDPDNIVQEPTTLETIFKINTLVSADIKLSKDTPLSAGNVEVTLLTSKTVTQKPSLSYSFDGTVYNKLFLTGSNDKWIGHIIIPDNLNEAILSFRLSAVDLDGRVGEIINSGESFVIDTINPNLISNINAVGQTGRIKLDWYIDDDIEEFKVYRSDSPDVDYTFYHETTDDSPYYDNSVEKGKTYYYRIRAVDKAGNEGALSKEVFATALLNNNSASSGLSLNLVGLVDNFLSEINLASQEITNIQNSIDLKSEKQKELFLDLQLEKEITDTKSELNAFKRDVENFKLQDLTKEELDNKLDSSRLRLKILKRKVPENLVILNEDSFSSPISEEDITEAILELGELSEKQREKSIKTSLEINEEENIKIESHLYILEIVYLDGTKNEISLVKREIDPAIENSNISFIEIIPKEVVESVSELEIKSSDYEIIKEDPILSFSYDTEQVVYFFNEKSSISSLKKAKLVPVNVIREEETLAASGITGYFLLGSGKTSYLGILVGIIVVILLYFYFWYLKKNKPSDLFLAISDNIELGLNFLKENKFINVMEIYDYVKKNYISLHKKEKSRIYSKIELFRNEIFLFQLKVELKKFEEGGGKSLNEFNKLSKIYNNLSEDYKEKISTYFDKIKKDLKNEN